VQIIILVIISEDMSNNKFEASKSNKEIVKEIGAIQKADLIDQAQYLGVCRNAYVAKWDAKREKFIYLRTKFGNTFAEEICHPEDDNGYDLFIPYERLISSFDPEWKYAVGLSAKHFPIEDFAAVFGRKK